MTVEHLLAATWEALTSVWTPATVLVASIAGMALGYIVLGYLAQLPAYANDATPGQVGRIVALGSALSGAIFYAGQVAAGVADGDPLADRIISRWGLWLVYSLAMGAGIWARLRIEQRNRRRSVLAQAAREVRGR